MISHQFKLEKWDLSLSKFVGLIGNPLQYNYIFPCAVVVFNLLEPGNISRALCGDQVGTLIDQTGRIS